MIFRLAERFGPRGTPPETWFAGLDLKTQERFLGYEQLREQEDAQAGCPFVR